LTLALFLLEHPLLSNSEIEYAPHQFFHRYSKDGNAKEFIKILENNSKINRIYFCRIEKDKSHAFAAIKLDSNWFLLDSLKKEPKKMNSVEELFRIENAGVASVMIVNHL
jgi:hypothetical protein